MAPVTVAAMTETVAPDRTFYQAPPAPPSYETEQVREFQPRETVLHQAAPVSAPGYAPAEPVKIEWPSDLQQVESDPGKVQIYEQQASQERAAPRPKRVRQPLPPAIDEPLVQIETERPGTATASAGEKAPV